MNGHAPRPGIPALVEDLVAARGELIAALDALGTQRLERPGLIGSWGGRQIVAHIGYWAGHAAEALHHAEQGRFAEFEADGEPDVERVNETVARVAAATPLATVRAREEAAFEALVERLRAADDAWLDLVSGAQESLAYVLAEDGPVHYREHAAQLRALAGGGA